LDLKPANSRAKRGVTCSLQLRVGTAGWSVPSQYAENIPFDGSHLERYATQLNAAEINTSFYRPHQRKTYERWAASTPADFTFSVKLPKAITHDLRLSNCEAPLERFLEEVTGLGSKLGVLLVQLPPSFQFEKQVVRRFFRSLRSRINCQSVIEPRHATWFTPEVQKWLYSLHVPRVAADPASVPEAGKAAGWDGFVYYRWHGSPRIYYSKYDATALSLLKSELDRQGDVPKWCIFDNTASGAAFGNALEFAALVGGRNLPNLNIPQDTKALRAETSASGPESYE
jgi:uncharacterized protein YecE (DUF72 family)